MCGINGTSEHDGPASESEVRDLITLAHRHGHLSRNEHSLINNVFEFDDMIVRRVMVPRKEVSFFDVDDTLPHIIEQVQRTKHTRYPVCNGSLDDVVGRHIKDYWGSTWIHLISVPVRHATTQKAHETMPISRFSDISRQPTNFSRGLTSSDPSLVLSLWKMFSNVSLALSRMSLIPNNRTSFRLAPVSFLSPVRPTSQRCGVNLASHSTNQIKRIPSVVCSWITSRRSQNLVTRFNSKAQRQKSWKYEVTMPARSGSFWKKKPKRVRNAAGV